MATKRTSNGDLMLVGMQVFFFFIVGGLLLPMIAVFYVLGWIATKFGWKF